MIVLLSTLLLILYCTDLDIVLADTETEKTIKSQKTVEQVIVIDDGQSIIQDIEKQRCKDDDSTDNKNCQKEHKQKLKKEFKIRSCILKRKDMPMIDPGRNGKMMIIEPKEEVDYTIIEINPDKGPNSGKTPFHPINPHPPYKFKKYHYPKFKENGYGGYSPGIRKFPRGQYEYRTYPKKRHHKE